MRLLIMGLPGSGKRTQAAYLAQDLGVPAISARDVSRSHLYAPTSLGLEAQGHLDRGGGIPDRVTHEMIRDRLVQQDAKYGWLLHGYPRTAAQLDALDELCDNCGHTLDAVILLGVPEPVLLGRLPRRASDDVVAAMERRLRLHREQTDPLVAAYLRRGILTVVDGRGSISEVRARCAAAASDAKSRVALV